MKTPRQFIPHCLILVLLLTLLCMPMAYAAEPKRGGTFVLAIGSEPQGLSPYVATGADDHCVTSNPFNLLVYQNLDLEIIPGLAESWEVSEDGLTYTFNLAKNATWHDGKPCTSADVVYTLRECLPKHPKGSGWWGIIKDSITLHAPDEHTVVMKLRKPFAPLLSMLSSEVGGAYILPKHLYEGTDLRKNPYNNKPIGTGPFMFKEWVKGSHAAYERNPNYFVRGKPYVDRLVVRFIPDSAGRVLALRKGEVDFINTICVPAEEVAQLRKDPNITVDGRGLEESVRFLMFNVRQPMLAKKEVRQAISYGIDKEKIVNLALAGEAIAGKSFIPTTIRWAHNPNVPKYSYNPQKANELLDKAGLVRGNDGIRFKLRIILASSRSSDPMVAEVIRDTLRPTGIDAEIIGTDMATFRAATQQSFDYDAAVKSMPCGGVEPMVNSNYLHSKNITKKGSTINYMGYSNPEVDKLLDIEWAQQDPKKRAAIWHQIQEIVIDDLPYIPINETPPYNCYRSEWADVVTKAYGPHQSREDAYLKK